MGKFIRFEEIDAWKLSFELVKEIYKVTNYEKVVKDFAFKDKFKEQLYLYLQTLQKDLRETL
jgi:hypothetical protein